MVDLVAVRKEISRYLKENKKGDYDSDLGGAFTSLLLSDLGDCTCGELAKNFNELYPAKTPGKEL